MSTYSDYLGNRRCCINNIAKTVTGPQGAQGAQGAIGPYGGPQGATGPSQWTDMNGIGVTGTGYTGIGVTGKDVLIYGNLLVTGGIDPTYLLLTPQLNEPTGLNSLNPLWVDSVNGNALRSNNIYLDNPDINNNYISLKPDNNTSQLTLADGTGKNVYVKYDSITINEQVLGEYTTLMHKQLTFYDGLTYPTIHLNSSNNDFIITSDSNKLLLNSGNQEFKIGQYESTTAPVIESTGTGMGLTLNSRSGTLYLGDTDNSYNQTSIVLDDPNSSIQILSNDVITIGGASEISIDQVSKTITNFSDGGTITNSVNGGNIDIESYGFIRIGDLNSGGNGQLITISNINKRIVLTAINGIYVNKGSIQYASTFNSANTTLDISSNYAQTYNGTAITVTLPTVTSTNFGLQFLITNTNGTNSITVSSSSGQAIYSGGSNATTRTLTLYTSRIFTAIRGTSNINYGWSMV